MISRHKNILFCLQFITIAISCLSCSDHRTELTYPAVAQYEREDRYFKMVASVIPPNNQRSDYEVQIEWKRVGTLPEFIAAPTWIISRSKGCPPSSLNPQDISIPKDDFKKKLEIGTEEIQSGILIDNTGFENDTCYSYRIQIEGVSRSKEGSDTSISVTSVKLAVPIGNAGFYR